MTPFLLTVSIVLCIIAADGLCVGLCDRKYRDPFGKRDRLIGVLVCSAGVFAATVASALDADGWRAKYLAPILLFAVATAATIAYTCLIGKIYAAKRRADVPARESGERAGGADAENGGTRTQWERVGATASNWAIVLGVVAGVMVILWEFTDLAERLPFLFGKVFVAILCALDLALVALKIACGIVVRKHKKRSGVRDDFDDGGDA